MLTVSLTKGWCILLSGGKYRLHSFPQQTTSQAVCLLLHKGNSIYHTIKRNKIQGHSKLDNQQKRLFQLYLLKSSRIPQ